MVRKFVCIKKSFFKIFIKHLLINFITTYTFVFFWIIFKANVFKKSVAIFIFNYASFTFLSLVCIYIYFMSSFRTIIDKIWQCACHRPWTINKLQYVRYIFCNFFSIFINSCNLFFYWNCKGSVFFNVLS